MEKGIINPTEEALMSVTSPEKFLWDQNSVAIERLYSEHLRRAQWGSGQGGRDAPTALKLLAIANSAFRGVPKDWKDGYPGEYLPAYFLHDSQGRVIAEELIDPEDRRAADLKGYRVVPLSGVLKSSCPKCHVPRLAVIEMVYEDRSQWFVVCTSCGAQNIKQP